MALAEALSPVEGHIIHPLESRKRALIIDTDAGIDDAQALVLALRSSECTIIAVTCTHGNVGLGLVEGNVCACLEACGRMQDVPVYVGADVPMVHLANEDASEWHGSDGLGNTGKGVTAARTCIRRDIHASTAIFTCAEQYLQQHGDKVDVVTLGPLTNLALAVRCHPRLPSLVGSVYVMGGAETGHGNVGYPNLTAEYNIYADAEAAAVVFSTFPRIVMSSWELTLKYGLQPSFLSRYLTRHTPLGAFLADVTQHLLTASGEEYIQKRGLMIPDPLAMCIALRPSVITSSERHSVFIETRGEYTRGQTVTDWKDASGKTRNVEVVQGVDFEQIKEMLLASVRD